MRRKRRWKRRRASSASRDKLLLGSVSDALWDHLIRCVLSRDWFCALTWQYLVRCESAALRNVYCKLWRLFVGLVLNTVFECTIYGKFIMLCSVHINNISRLNDWHITNCFVLDTWNIFYFMLCCIILIYSISYTICRVSVCCSNFCITFKVNSLHH